MAKKVSKNQRTDRGKNRQEIKMAKLVVSQRKSNGKFSYRTRMVSLDNVDAELKSAQS